MGFLSALRHFLADRPPAQDSEEVRGRIRDAWGLDDEPGSIAPGPDAAEASAYDRNQWRRKLNHFFVKPPASDAEWADLLSEAKALKLDDAWVAAGMRDEFTMMIRGLVADRRLSEDEQARLEAVRKRIGLGEEEAAELVRSVVADARRFFGADVVVDP